MASHPQEFARLAIGFNKSTEGCLCGIEIAVSNFDTDFYQRTMLGFTEHWRRSENFYPEEKPPLSIPGEKLAANLSQLREKLAGKVARFGESGCIRVEVNIAEARLLTYAELNEIEELGEEELEDGLAEVKIWQLVWTSQSVTADALCA